MIWFCAYGVSWYNWYGVSLYNWYSVSLYSCFCRWNWICRVYLNGWINRTLFFYLHILILRNHIRCRRFIIYHRKNDRTCSFIGLLNVSIINFRFLRSLLVYKFWEILFVFGPIASLPYLQILCWKLLMANLYSWIMIKCSKIILMIFHICISSGKYSLLIII
jgi:hypothetical protein